LNGDVFKLRLCLVVVDRIESKKVEGCQKPNEFVRQSQKKEKLPRLLPKKKKILARTSVENKNPTHFKGATKKKITPPPPPLLPPPHKQKTKNTLRTIHSFSLHKQITPQI